MWWLSWEECLVIRMVKRMIFIVEGGVGNKNLSKDYDFSWVCSKMFYEVSSIEIVSDWRYK